MKGPAEDHFRNDVAEGRKLGKPVVVAGCVPQGQPKAKYIEVKRWDSVVFLILQFLVLWAEGLMDLWYHSVSVIHF